MKTASIALLLMALCATTAGVLEAEELLPGIDYVPGQIVITFRATSQPDSTEVTETPPFCGVAAVDSLMAEYSAIKLVKVFPEYASPRLEGFLRRMFVIHLPDTVDVEGALTEFAQVPEIEYADLNRIYAIEYCGTRRLCPPTTTAFSQQWHLDGDLYFPEQDTRVDIDAPEAWAIERGDPSVVIGILDTGMMLDISTTPWSTHSDFDFLRFDAEDHESPGVFSAADFSCASNFSDDDGDGVKDNIIGHGYLHGYSCAGDDDHPGACPVCDVSSYNEKEALYHGFPQNWQLEYQTRPGGIELLSWKVVEYLAHGVRVASIAASQWEGTDAIGVAPTCKIYPNRNIGGDVVYAVQMFVEIAKHCDVMNMSWHIAQPNIFLEEGVRQAARKQNCVLVAAIGNGVGTPTGVKWPARYGDVLAVGSITRSMQTAGDSNYNTLNEYVDVVAPVDEGVIAGSQSEDTLTSPIQERVESTGTGTSFAAPQAAGVAGLIRARFPGMRQYAVRDRIKRAAQFYWDKNNAMDRRMYGSGKINAYRSVTEWGSIEGVTSWREFAGAPADTLVESRDGTYYVSGDLTVGSSATLTINAGTTIKIAPDYPGHEAHGTDTDRVEIVVEGTLNAIGTANDPIVFESFTDATPGDDDWVGIRFDPGSTAVLKNVIIRNAEHDIVVDEFDISVDDWDETKTLHLSSDFSITSDLTIPSSDSLFVLGASDVVVTGGSDVDITVNGSLICKGSASKKPEFRSSTGNPRSWDLITLTANSENNLFHNVIIQDAEVAIRSYVPLTVDSCLIQDGVDGIQAYADLVVKNTAIHDLTGVGIYWFDGDLEVTNVEIYDAAYGIVQSTSTGALLCRGSRLHDIDYRGIDVASASDGVTIKHTSVEDATDGIYLAFQDSPVIDSCQVLGNDIGIRDVWSEDLLVRSCAIVSNVTSGVFLAGSVVTMEADTVSGNPVGAFFIYPGGGIVTGQSLISENTVGVKCDYGADPVIEASWIIDNTDGVAALNGSAPDLGHAYGDTCADPVPAESNRIHGNSGYHVVNLSPSVTIAAGGNWWGGSIPHSNKFSGAVDRLPYNCDDDPPFVVATGGGDQPPPDGTPKPNLPARYALATNQPNPFNPVTSMRYDVPSPGGRVDITIFDVAGRKVRTLTSGVQAPGTYTATWDGRDDRGVSGASGVYFVRMTAGRFVQTRKVVLLK